MDNLQAQIRFRIRGHDWISSEPFDASDIDDMIDQLMTLRDEAIDEIEGYEDE